MAQENKKKAQGRSAVRNELGERAPGDSPSKKAARYALSLFKLSFSAVLLYFLISKVGGRTILDNLRLLNPFAFAAAVVLYFIGSYLSTLRWKLLVPQMVGPRRLFSMYMIGAFFNHYMPGGVGGDAVKAYYLSRELKREDATGRDQGGTHSAPVTTAVASVFMDRYVGFATLLTISLAVFPFGIGYLQQASEKLPVIWIIPVLSVLFAITTVAIFKFRVGEKLRFLSKAYAYLQLYVARRNIILRAMLYSAAVQFSVFVSVYILAQGLHMHVSFLTLLVFVPMIIIFSMIPVTISGIGLREGAFIFLLGTVGITPERSMTLSLVWYVSVFASSTWGLFEYLRFKALFGGKEE